MVAPASHGAGRGTSCRPDAGAAATGVTLIVDAGALYAQADADDPTHGTVVRLLRSERGLIVTSELAVAEADHLILDRPGVDVEVDFLTDLAEGTIAVECLTRADLGEARAVVQRYRDVRPVLITPEPEAGLP
jgi:predicted nucleic acid-binding protein